MAILAQGVWLHRCLKERLPWLSGLATVPPITVRQDGEVSSGTAGSIFGNVDANPVAEDVRKSVAEFLHGAGVAGPKALDGVTQEDIFEVGSAPERMQVHERALIRRLLRMAAVSTS